MDEWRCSTWLLSFFVIKSAHEVQGDTTARVLKKFTQQKKTYNTLQVVHCNLSFGHLYHENSSPFVSLVIKVVGQLLKLFIHLTLWRPHWHVNTIIVSLDSWLLALMKLIESDCCTEVLVSRVPVIVKISLVLYISCHGWMCTALKRPFLLSHVWTLSISSSASPSWTSRSCLLLIQ